ncbi:MAG: hypothetical protein SCK57_13100 [Bacillota bacterium]|nr:hypothetical protein [Bacillota bacterium]
MQPTQQPPHSPSHQPTISGWVKLHRELMHKPIWHQCTAVQKVLLITLLMKASYRGNSWVHQGIAYHLKPGQLITSINRLVEECGEGATHRKVRTALSLFEKYGFLTIETTNQHSLITIANWESYQNEPPAATQPPTHERHTGDTRASHQPTTNKKVRMTRKKEGKEPLPPAAEEAAAVDNTEPRAASCPFDEILALYHRHCTDLPKIKQLTAHRKEALQQRWREYRQDLAVFRTLFEKAQASPYLRGQNPRGWRADFDWLLQEGNMARTLEGLYEKPITPAPAPQTPTRRTSFHLPESRFSQYSNEQLEAILLGKKKQRQSRTQPEKEASHGT